MLDALERTDTSQLSDASLQAHVDRLLGALGWWWWEVSWDAAIAVLGEQLIGKLGVPNLAHPVILFRGNDSHLLEAERALRQAATTGEVEAYLARFGQMKHAFEVAVVGSQPTYAGTEACKRCHDTAYTAWKASKHSHAYQTLVDAKWPSNRQYDAECIVCHTVGFGYKTGFKDAEKASFLKNVGCESCHGPGKAHSEARGGKATIIAFSELGPAKTLDACLRCHGQTLWLVGCQPVRRSFPGSSDHLAGARS